jgi:hypothetical protein
MSFSEGISKGTKLDPDKGQFDRRGDDELKECSYPNCRSRKIARDEDAVEWDLVHISTEEYEWNVSPLAKLAIKAHPKEYSRGNVIDHYFVTLYFHAGCAAEWGMHLIKDALKSDNVNRKLRKEKPNAIRKQTKTL